MILDDGQKKEGKEWQLFFMTVDPDIAKVLTFETNVIKFDSNDLQTMSTIRLQVKEEIRKTSPSKDHRSSEVQFFTSTNILKKRKSDFIDDFSRKIMKMSAEEFDFFESQIRNKTN